MELILLVFVSVFFQDTFVFFSFFQCFQLARPFFHVFVDVSLAGGYVWAKYDQELAPIFFGIPDS